MKSLIPLLLVGASLYGADAIKPPTAKQVTESIPAKVNPYAAGNWSLSTFGTYRIHAFDGKVERFGAGAGLSYFLKENIAIEPYFVSEGLRWEERPFSESFTDAGLNFKAFLPLGTSGFAAYGLIGYSHGFGLDSRRVRMEESVCVIPGKDDDDRMAAGAGLNFHSNTKFLGITPALFADGVWLNNFVQPGHALFRAGLSGTF